MSLILLTNDDGISAEGLRSLEEFLRGLGEIVVVAPDRERSAVSHGLTIHSPLQINRLDPRHYTLNGTPADCVICAVRQLLPAPPDLVVSGINHGANLGEDILYSGTVAAAREASKRGLAAIAVSQAFDDRPISFREGGRFVRSFVKSMLQKSQVPGTCLNVNLPVGEYLGVKVTRQGTAFSYQHFNMLNTESDRPPAAETHPHASKKRELTSDFEAVADRFISITPLHRDQTDYEAVETLREEMTQFLQGRRSPPRMGLIR